MCCLRDCVIREAGNMPLEKAQEFFRKAGNGHFTPCRHLDYPEQFAGIETAERGRGLPGASLRIEPRCLSRIAVNAKLGGRLTQGNDYCSL